MCNAVTGSIKLHCPSQVVHLFCVWPCLPADYTNGVEGFTYNYYEDLTPEDTLKIVDQLRNGEQPKVGSQHRNKAEPAGAVANGKWVPAKGIDTLMGEPLGPYCRNLDEPPPQPAA